MASIGPPTFGEVLRQYRLVAGLTQEALAERAHLSTRAISALEQGVNHAPRAATLALIAEALGLPDSARAALVAVAGRRDKQVAGPQRARGRSTIEPLAPLVGREAELARLEAHLAREGPPLLLLAGEPGIGKSRLLQHTVERAPGAGWRVLAGGCLRRGGQEPYAPVVQALTRYLWGERPVRLRAELRGCAWLVRLLPELADGPLESLPTWTVSPEQERRLMFTSVERFLANVAGPAGTLLVLDDLQWVSADTVDLLTVLVRAAEEPVRIVGAYRDTEVAADSPLTIALADLASAGLAHHHTLAPLAPQAVRQLLDVLLDGIPGDSEVLAARVARRAGGVPFFLVSCVHAMRREPAATGEETIPWDVAQGIRQRVAALPPTARKVIEAAATAVGRSAQAPILAAVLECPEREVLAGLDAAWQGRLLEEVNGVYRFPHDLIRETLEADLGPARRTILHRRMAEALEAGSARHLVGLLAYHYSHSDVPDRAIPYLEQAGDHARSQLGIAAAVDSYQMAVERLESLGRRLEAARVREKLGGVLRTGARYADALQILDPAAETYRAKGDMQGEGRVMAEIAQVHTDRGTSAEGLTRLQPTLDLLARHPPSRALAALYVSQADLLFMLGRLREDLAATVEGERIARAVGDDEHLAGALYLRGVALFTLGRIADAVEPLREAIRVAEATGAYSHLGWALMTLGWTLEELGEFGPGRDSTERALHIGERHGFLMMVAYLTMRRGSNSFLTGAWTEARQDFERAAALGREVGPYWGSVYPALGLAALCVAAGDSEASQHLEECQRLLSSGGDAVACRQFACVVAERDLLDGRPEEARARLASALDRDELEEEGAAPLLPFLAWALLELGEVEAAAELAGHTVARLRAAGRQLVLLDALRVVGLLELRQAHWQEAHAALQEGLSLARCVGHPYAEARFLHVHGELNVQTRQPERAQELLRGALVIFRRLNARKHLERVEHQLRTLQLGQQRRR